MKMFNASRLAVAVILATSAASTFAQTEREPVIERAEVDTTLPPNAAGMTDRQPNYGDNNARSTQSPAAASGAGGNAKAGVASGEPSAATTEVGLGYTDYSDTTESTRPHSDETGNNQASQSEAVTETTYSPPTDRSTGVEEAARAEQAASQQQRGAGDSSPRSASNASVSGAAEGGAANAGSVARALFDTVSFQGNSASLGAQAEQTLNRLANQIDKQAPASLAVRVQEDSASGGEALPQQRAEAIRHYLEQQGVQIVDAQVVSLQAEPLGATEVTEAMRQEPQRIVVTILAGESNDRVSSSYEQ